MSIAKKIAHKAEAGGEVQRQAQIAGAQRPLFLVAEPARYPPGRRPVEIRDCAEDTACS